MRHRGASVALVAVLALTRALHSPALRACSFGAEYRTVLLTRPDGPLGAYAAGRLGLPRPGWARSYLVVAYRHLSGLGLDSEAQAAAVELWETRLGRGPFERAEDGVEAWTAARALAGLAVEPPVSPFARTTYEELENCTNDAFRTAAATLTRKLEEDPARGPRVQEWVAAQDMVFSNCSREKGARIPAEPAGLVSRSDSASGVADAVAGSSASDQADRRYQIAAATFYAGEYEAAATLFRGIAEDASSPWHRTAPYLVARCLLRQGALREEGVRPSLLAAKGQLERLLEERRLPELRGAMLRHLVVIDPLLASASLAGELSETLLEPAPGADFGNLLDRYTRVLDSLGMRGAIRPEAGDDLSLWIRTFQDASPDSLRDALGLYRETKSLPWLVACLEKLRGGESDEAEIVQAATRLPLRSPARLIALYHRTRLLLAAGCTDEAHALLDGAPLDEEAMGLSAWNRFLDLRIRLSRRLEEFAANAPRRAYWLDGTDERVVDLSYAAAAGQPQEVYVFERETTDILNRYFTSKRLGDLETLLRSALSGNPDPLRRAIWVRELLLEHAEAKPVDRFHLLRDDQASTPWVRPLGETRDDALWWCGRDRTPFGDLAPPPPFLTTKDLADAAVENDRLAALGAAASFFCREAIRFARRHPADPAAPEILHLAVRGTREGCGDQETPALARRAFQLLHSRYGKTAQAKAAPYWFQGR